VLIVALAPLPEGTVLAALALVLCAVLATSE
jgi:hypothetical protein